MIIKQGRIILLALLLLLGGTIFLNANPFLGAPEEAPPQVGVSRPASQDLIEKQLTIRDKLADIMLALQSEGAPRLLLLLGGLSFLYGVLHAAGPGHRKTVVFSLYLSRNANRFEPLFFGFLLSLLHASSAVVLILLYQSAAGPLFSRKINAASLNLERWSYMALAALSLLMLIGAIRHATKGHAHGQQQKRSLAAIALTGAIPCPGATMILIFTLAHNMLTLGILSVAVMSLGMALPISLAGYLGYWGKQGVFAALHKKEKILHRTALGMELTGYTILLLFSLLMARPFMPLT